MEKTETQTQVPEKEPSKTLIYVSNLPFSTTDEQLKGLFKDFDVKTAYVATRKNGRSKGFGFVNLAKPEQQQKAIEKVNGSELEGRTLGAKVAFNDPRRNEKGELKEEFKKQLENPEPSKTAVYISNLPFALDDEGLKKVFTDFNIKSATVATRGNGRSMGFGFVEFADEEGLKKALTYDKKEVDGREISVSVAKNYLGPNRPKRRRKKKGRFSRNRFSSRSRQGGNAFSLRVENLPYDLDSNDLNQIFAEFNPVRANVVTQQNGRSRGFGFVDFRDAKAARIAKEELDLSEVNNRVIRVKQNRRGPLVVKRRRPQQQRRRRREQREQRERVPSKTLVYVANLPFALDDKGLAELFKGYKVNKAYVATRKNGRSKGFGFVDFASHEEQERAVKESTELTSQERKLRVQVANEPPVKEESNQTTTENN